jgi:hypothetical protein
LIVRHILCTVHPRVGLFELVVNQQHQTPHGGQR